MLKLFSTFAIILFSIIAYGKPATPVIAPQNTACINTKFTSTGSPSWQTINLQVTNNCNQPVDFQAATITFLNKSNLNQTFWGNFSPLSYPDSSLYPEKELRISSQQQATGNYLSSLKLYFPSYAGSKSVLPAGASFTIIYGAPTADYIEGSVNIYLGSLIGTGQINLTNNSRQPTNIPQSYALVNLLMNGKTISSV